MKNPYMFISGIMVIGFFVPEILVAFGRVKIPPMFNILFSIGCGLIAGAFVL